VKTPYPIMLNIAGKPVAVVGGGQVAARKVRGLLAAAADVTVVSPTLAATIDPITVHWLQQPYTRAAVADALVIIACTDDPAVNQRVKAEATPGQLVNNASDKANSDFYNVAVATSDSVMVTVSTAGRSPHQAKQIRQEIQHWLRTQSWRDRKE